LESEQVLVQYRVRSNVCSVTGRSALTPGPIFYVCLARTLLSFLAVSLFASPGRRAANKVRPTTTSKSERESSEKLGLHSALRGRLSADEDFFFFLRLRRRNWPTSFAKFQAPNSQELPLLTFRL